MSTLSGVDGFGFTGAGEELFGFCVIGVDINNDGKSDLAIGVPKAGLDAGEFAPGVVYVLFGRAAPYPSMVTASDINGAAMALCLQPFTQMV